MFVIHEPKEIAVDRVGVKGKVFPSHQLTDKVEFLLITTETGHETTIVEHECDFIYYVLEGNGYFEINGEREDCATADLVVIPAGNSFTYKGTLKMLLIDTPLWNERQEEVV